MKINKNMTIGKLVQEHPDAIEVLYEFGMGCVGCPSAQAETIEEACFVHNYNVEILLEKLNERVK